MIKKTITFVPVINTFKVNDKHDINDKLLLETFAGNMQNNNNIYIYITNS